MSTNAFSIGSQVTPSMVWSTALGRLHGHFEAFPADRFHDHRELELTAAGNEEFVGRLRGFHTNRGIAERFLLQERTISSRDRSTLPSRPAIGDEFHEEAHVHGGRIHFDALERVRILAAGDGVADVDRREADDHDDFARLRLLGLLRLQVDEGLDLRSTPGSLTPSRFSRS